MKGREFYGSLESLRGIAALLVALYHAYWSFPLYSTHLVRNGYLMVDFFFVLSGFVISLNYGSYFSGIRNLAVFMVARFRRLYPMHILTMLAFAVYEFLLYGIHHRSAIEGWHALQSIHSAGQVIANLLLIQTLGFSHMLSFNLVSWSISTEFYVYLLFGAVALLIPSLRLRTGIALLISLGALTSIMMLGHSNFSLPRTS